MSHKFYIIKRKIKIQKKKIIIDESRKNYTYLNGKGGIDITKVEIKPDKDNININNY